MEYTLESSEMTIDERIEQLTASEEKTQTMLAQTADLSSGWSALPRPMSGYRTLRRHWQPERESGGSRSRPQRHQ